MGKFCHLEDLDFSLYPILDNFSLEFPMGVP